MREALDETALTTRGTPPLLRRQAEVVSGLEFPWFQPAWRSEVRAGAQWPELIGEKVEDGRRNEDEAVEAIEPATVPWQDNAEVLKTEIALIDESTRSPIWPRMAMINPNSIK